MPKHLLVLLSLLCLSLFACSPKPASPLRVGISTWPGYEFLYLAKVKDFYRQRGVAVEIIQFNSLGDSRRAFERGQIDVLASTMVELLVASENIQQPLHIIGVLDASAGADKLIANPKYTSLKDLKGQKVGLEGGTVTVLAVQAAMHYAHLSLRDLQLVAQSQEDLSQGLESGKLAAVQSYPPYSTKLLQKGYVNLFDTSKIPDQIIDVVSTRPELIKTRASDLKKLMLANFDAYQYFKTHRAEATQIVSAREGLTLQAFTEAIQEIRFFDLKDQAEYLNSPKGLAIIRSASEGLFLTGWLQRTIQPQDFFSPNWNFTL